MKNSILTVLLLLLMCLVLPACNGDGDDDNEQMASSGLEIDENAGEDRPSRVLIRKISGNREARYVSISSGSTGGISGTAIRLYENGNLRYAKFASFGSAISRGNSWTASGTLTEDSDSEPTTSDTETTVEDEEGLGDATHEFEENNIRMLVRPNNLAGYNVSVFVDGVFIIRLYKDCNTCSIYSESTAVSKAQGYLSSLQGWIKIVS